MARTRCGLVNSRLARILALQAEHVEQVRGFSATAIDGSLDAVPTSGRRHWRSDLPRHALTGRGSCSADPDIDTSLSGVAGGIGAAHGFRSGASMHRATGRSSCFRYVRGALHAQEPGRFRAVVALPELDRRYESIDLFPLFKNRVLVPAARVRGICALDGSRSGRCRSDTRLPCSEMEAASDRISRFSPAFEQPGWKRVRCRFFLSMGLHHVPRSRV